MAATTHPLCGQVHSPGPSSLRWSPIGLPQVGHLGGQMDILAAFGWGRRLGFVGLTALLDQLRPDDGGEVVSLPGRVDAAAKEVNPSEPLVPASPASRHQFSLSRGILSCVFPSRFDSALSWLST